MENKALLLLGSNVGDRLKMLRLALENIEHKIGRMLSLSSIYRTEAWGKENMPYHLNQALMIATSLTAVELIQQTQKIEHEMGRQKIEKWGERNIDIDIIFFNDEIINLPHLQIPHPYVQERRFALVPIDEIIPEYIHPVLQQSVHEMLENTQDLLAVVKYDFTP